MKIRYLIRNISHPLIIILFCLMSTLSFADNYLIVSEKNHKYHKKIVKEINAKLSLLKHTSSVISTDDLDPENYSRYNSVITIGYTAASQLFETNKNTPVLSLLIPLQAFQQLENNLDKQYRYLFSSIYIDQPISRQIELIRHLSDRFLKIGIIFGKNSYSRKESITKKIKNAGFKPKAITVLDRTELISETRYLSEESDILLAVPDSSIYNKRSIKGILLTTYRKKTPVLGFSKAYVRAGALAAVYSSAEDICRQAMQTLVNQKESGYITTSRSYPQYFDIRINKKVAHSLNITITDKNIILKKMLADNNNAKL